MILFRSGNNSFAYGVVNAAIGIGGIAASLPIPFIMAAQNVILYEKIPATIQGRVFAVRNAVQYEKCLYMIAEEMVNGEDIKEKLFRKTTTYLQEHHYEPQGIVFIKPLLISYPLQKPATYIEIYVPLKKI